MLISWPVSLCVARNCMHDIDGPSIRNPIAQLPRPSKYETNAQFLTLVFGLGVLEAKESPGDMAAEKLS